MTPEKMNVQQQGGWLNSDSVSWFEEYARVCFREFGDEVKMWATFNEPWIVSMSGYGEGYFPPGAQNDQGCKSIEHFRDVPISYPKYVGSLCFET